MTSQNKIPREDIDVTSLIKLFNIESKNDLEKYCRSIVIYQKDFVALILGAQTGILTPYKYACHFDRKAAPHLIPTDKELHSLANNGMGTLQKKAKKAASKMFHLIDARRCFSAHLFYTPCHSYWYLFYSDQRDQASRRNHWGHGSHIHLITSHWANLELEKVWEQVLKGNTNFSNKIHLRYSTD